MEEAERVKLERDMLKCQTKVYQDMHELAGNVHGIATRVTHLETGHKEIKDTLKIHEEQRRGMHQKHDEKLELILSQISSINTKTDDNTDFIDKIRKYWVRSSFIATGVVSTILALWWLYHFLEKHGMVIIFEQGQ